MGKETEHNYLLQFKKLFSEYFEPLRIYAFRYVRDNDVARDVVQETFMSLWKNRREIDFNLPLKPLLYTYTRNRALDCLKSASIKNESLETTPIQKLDAYVMSLVEEQPDNDLHYTNLREEVVGFVETLPKQCREVFRLSRYSGLKNREIADALGISIKMVEKHIATALSRLREHLVQKGFILMLGLWTFFQ